jgi:hypothetical protein
MHLTQYECYFQLRKILITGCLLMQCAMHSQLEAATTDSLKLINNLRLGADLHYGTILPHSKAIEYSLESNIERFELTLATNSYGRSDWDRAYRFPRLGAGYLYTSLGNDKVFGHAHAFFLSMDIPFFKIEKKLSTNYQISFGLAYLSRVFDINENPLNMAISSGLNVYGCFNLNSKYRLDNRSELRAGFGFSHFSNGKLATPNLGINSFTLSAGYSYNLTNSRYERKLNLNGPKLMKHQAEVILSGGTKTDDQVTGIYYLVSSFVADYKYVPTLKYAVGLGADLFYDQSLGPNKIAEEGGASSTTDLFQTGLHAGFYTRYSHLSVMLQIGSYVFANYYKYARVYSRIGIRYEVFSGILLNLSLKSHYAIADYIEWGIGYRFNNQEKK